MARHDTEVNYITNCDVTVANRHISIARVKFVVGADSLDIAGFALYEADEYDQGAPALAAFPPTITSDTVTLDIPMYKGGAHIALVTDGTVAVSGDLYLDNNMIYITGDGTVTVA